MRKNCYFRLFRLTVFFCLLGILIGTTLPAVVAGTSASQLQINVITKPKNKEFGWVYITGMDPNVLAQLQKSNPDIHEWRQFFSVQLRSQSSKLEIQELPNVAGQYEILKQGLRFVPRFTPTQGLIYHVGVRIDGYKPTEGVFVLNDALQQVHATANVDTIYPSARGIPENTLRLYIHFSSPMRRGQVLEKIRLLDDSNEIIQNAFIIGPLGELWDHDQRRLTLLLDPGRIKRGVGPNRKVGPALKAGDHRTLIIDRQFKDAKGRPIEAEFRKTYQIGEAICDAVSPRNWVITAPPSGTRAPLQIRFTRTLDSGMLSHTIEVYKINGERIKGYSGFTANETKWSFTPTEPWSNRNHIIKVATNLEDISGNNTLAPLDVTVDPLFAKSSQKPIGKYKEIPFRPIK